MSTGAKIYLIFIILIFGFYILLNFFDLDEINIFDYARITDIDYTAVLVDEPDSNGKIVVTERITFDVHALSENNLYWELWRDLPESTIDGVRVTYTVNSVKQILDDGTEIVYEESPKLYWYDSDYINTSDGLGPGKWYHSEGPYSESARRYECVLFYVDGLYRENVTFEIEYEMYNAALRYGDCSELYLSLYSGETIQYLDSFKAQILIPDKDMPSQGNYEAHTYGTDSYNFPYYESTTLNPGYHTFYFELDSSDLKFNVETEYLEFTLISYGSDKHIFTDYASKNYYYTSNVLDELRSEHAKFMQEKYIVLNAKIFVFIICLTLTILIFVYLYRRDRKIRKKYTFYEPTMQIDYFREIPSKLDPIFAANLVFCKNRKQKFSEGDEYASILLSLVRKGYIMLERINSQKDWNSNNINIIIKEKPVSPDENSDNNVSSHLEALTYSETQYFKLISRHASNGEIKMSTFQSKVGSDYEYTSSFMENMNNLTKKIGMEKGYFQTQNYLEPKNHLKSVASSLLFLAFISIFFIASVVNTPIKSSFVGFIILDIALIIGYFYLKRISNKYVLLTQFGEDEYAKWKGLYDFLNSETLMNERTVVDLPLWEEYLVYATAFGISDKVIKALKLRCSDFATSPIFSNPYYISTKFYFASNHFSKVTRHSITRAMGGSYHGGHGGSFGHGYGGGGRGGGGGRRRSLNYIGIFPIQKISETIKSFTYFLYFVNCFCFGLF